MAFNNTYKTYDFGVRGELNFKKHNLDHSDPFHIVALYDGSNTAFNQSLGLSYGGVQKVFGQSNTYMTEDHIKNNASIIFTLCECIDDADHRVVYFSSDYEDMFEMNVHSHRQNGVIEVSGDVITSGNIGLNYRSSLDNVTLQNATTHYHKNTIALSGQNLKRVNKENVQKSISGFTSTDYSLDSRYVYTGVPYDILEDVDWVFKKTTKTGYANGYIEAQKHTIESIPKVTSVSDNNYIPPDDRLAYYLDFDSGSTLIESLKHTLTTAQKASVDTRLTSIGAVTNKINTLITDNLLEEGACAAIQNNLFTYYKNSGLLYNTYYNFFGGNVAGTCYTNHYNFAQTGDIYKGEQFNTLFGVSVNTHVGTLGTLDKTTSRPIFVPSIKHYELVRNSSSISTIELKDGGLTLSEGSCVFRLSSTGTYTNSGTSPTNTVTSDDLSINGFVGVSYNDGGNPRYINYYYNRMKEWDTDQNKDYIKLHFDKSMGGSYQDVSLPYSNDFDFYFFKPPKPTDFFSVSDTGVSFGELKQHMKFYLIPTAENSHLGNLESTLQSHTFDSSTFINYGDSKPGAIFHTIKQQHTDIGASPHALHTATHHSIYTGLLRRNNGLGSFWAVKSNNLLSSFGTTYGDINSFNNYITTSGDVVKLRQRTTDTTYNIPLFYTNLHESTHGIWYRYCDGTERCGVSSCMGLIDRDILDFDDFMNRDEFGIEDFDKCVVNAEANQTSTHKTKFVTVGTANATTGDSEDDSIATTAKGLGDTRHKKNHHLLPIIIGSILGVFLIFLAYHYIQHHKKNAKVKKS